MSERPPLRDVSKGEGVPGNEPLTPEGQELLGDLVRTIVGWRSAAAGPTTCAIPGCTDPDCGAEDVVALEDGEPEILEEFIRKYEERMKNRPVAPELEDLVRGIVEGIVGLENGIRGETHVLRMAAGICVGALIQVARAVNVPLNFAIDANMLAALGLKVEERSRIVTPG